MTNIMSSDITSVNVPQALATHPDLSSAYQAVHSAAGIALLKQLYKLNPNLAITITHAHTEDGLFRPLAADERSVEIDQHVHFETITPSTESDTRASVAWRMVSDDAGERMVACADCSTHGCGEGGDGTGDGLKPDHPDQLPARGKTPLPKPAPAIKK